MKLLLLVVGLSSFLTGCVTTEYSPYVGQQKNWPTADGAFVNEIHGIAIYDGFPSKPYDVLGRVEVIERRNHNMLAKTAKSHGADAVIITSANAFDAGAVNFSNTAGATTVGVSAPVRRRAVVGWLIKFKTEVATSPLPR